MPTFREEDVAGAKETMDRPASQEMMTALHSNGVDVVLIEKLDRLARDLMVQESVFADLRRYGFELISVHEPDLMATNHTRVLIRQMMGALAQYDKSRSLCACVVQGCARKPRQAAVRAASLTGSVKAKQR